MKCICYISIFADDINKSVINELIKKIASNNKKNNITGILIIRNKHFFQIIEGENHQIDKLYKTISNDKRHHNIIKLLENELLDRLFTAYNSGEFEIFQKNKNFDKLLTYYRWIRNANYLPADQLISLSKKFIGHH
ncbi:FAD-dependent sensor of blue light [Nonlabens xylanidelens]|uniref:FAD-dependent sensor of blue light n=1 Tax=Nonlabens xylanidelens TaxID=191564 RepID=A0A2S6IPP7_9FLAO|nr:BLUF domain-containing protein [Nonlabens xylanidelens]PPK96232.1 FAD-dependent sensor of blue light [Nonlabens xylanidelens]